MKKLFLIILFSMFSYQVSAQPSWTKNPVDMIISDLNGRSASMSCTDKISTWWSVFGDFLESKGIAKGKLTIDKNWSSKKNPFEFSYTDGIAKNSLNDQVTMIVVITSLYQRSRNMQICSMAASIQAALNIDGEVKLGPTLNKVYLYTRNNRRKTNSQISDEIKEYFNGLLKN